MNRIEIGVRVITYAPRSARVESALNRLPGAIEADLDLAIERAGGPGCRVALVKAAMPDTVLIDQGPGGVIGVTPAGGMRP